jgi:hypothetical protein
MRFQRPAKTKPVFVRTFLSIVVCAGFQSPLIGDGFFQQIPKEGAWVKYRMTNKLFGPSARESERKGELRISCVGTVNENGRECRWIEIRDENRHLGGKVAYVYLTKFLVPVKSLAHGNPGHKDILRVWRKKGDNDPELTQGPIENGMRYGIYFPGATADVASTKTSEHKTFVVNGNMIRSESTRQQRAEFDTTYHHILNFRLWTHAGTPFGVAGAQIESRAYHGDRHQHTFVRNYELFESGKDATSELPNCN